MNTERKVGLFFISGLVLLGGMLEAGEKWSPFGRRPVYNTFLSSVTGLKAGDPVRLAGVDVGRITAIVIHDSNVEIVFEVEPGTRIKSDSVASLRLTNLLGGQFLSLSFGSPSAPLLEAGRTVAGKDSANIDVIVDNISDAVRDARLLITGLNENQQLVMGEMAALLSENRAGIRATVESLRSASARLDRGDGSLALLLRDRGLYDSLSAAGASLGSLAAKLDRGDGTLARLVNDPALYAELRGATAELRSSAAAARSGFDGIGAVTAKINAGEGTLGKLVNDPQLHGELVTVSRNLGEIAAKINSGQGTLGKLVNEDRLYRDSVAAMKKVEKAAEGISDSGPISVLGGIVGTMF